MEMSLEEYSVLSADSKLYGSSPLGRSCGQEERKGLKKSPNTNVNLLHFLGSTTLSDGLVVIGKVI